MVILRVLLPWLPRLCGTPFVLVSNSLGDHAGAEGHAIAPEVGQGASRIRQFFEQERQLGAALSRSGRWLGCGA